MGNVFCSTQGCTELAIYLVEAKNNSFSLCEKCYNLKYMMEDFDLEKEAEPRDPDDITSVEASFKSITSQHIRKLKRDMTYK